jgi:uncharacterized membrane protein
MIESPKTLGIKEFLFLILVFLIATDLAILLNIPFLRQILGFLFLTFLPGLLLLQVLKLNKFGYTEKFVLVVGFSISFLMFFGLLINNLSLYMGYKTPLSTLPQLICFNLATIALILVVYRINRNTGFSLPNFNLSTSEKAFLVVPVLFPALSIFGMHVMNATDNNIILMFLLFLIPIYVVFVCFFNHKFPKKLYPVVIFLISISLLLLMALRSNHIIGVDTHDEYYFFQTTLNNLHWSISGHSTLDACLAISLLPTIYQSILNIPPEFLFKIFYSLIFSISPLVVYILSKKHIGEFYGFLTSVFFMFQVNVLGTELHARTNTAILFFALAMVALFSDKIDPLKKRILFIVFMASCMVSHYSTTYIFFFIMVVTFIGIEMLSKKYTFKKVISLTITILFFALIFFWYSQVTAAAFNSGVGFIENTLSNLNKFFVEEARCTSAQAMLGEGIMEKGIPHKIEFLFTWLIFAFIGIGIITLIRRHKEMSFPELKLKKPDFLNDKFEVTYFVIALVLSGLLVATVALPYITVGYSLERQYTLAIVILSVFFVIGGIILSKHFFFFVKRKPVLKEKQKEWRKGEIWKGKENAAEIRAYLIILLVLIPYFLCITGVMYNIFGVPRAITLNSEGEQYDTYYVHDQESSAAMWLKSNTAKKAKVYSDKYGNMRLLSQGGIHSIFAKSLIEDKKVIKKGYIYLRYYNVIDGKLLGSVPYNITDYSDIFGKMSKVYANGGSDVWKK